MDKENMFVIDWLNEIIKNEDDWILFYSSSEVKLLAEKTLATLKEQEELLHKKQKDIDKLCIEISRLKHKLHPIPDCEHAEHDGAGCLGYSGCSQDDEPIDACKNCDRYTGNIVREW